MGNVVHYLKWRGDLTMLERPFNDIDNLILSMLIYVDYEKIRSEIRCGNQMKLSEALNELLERGYTSKCLMEVKSDFLCEVSKSKRFRNIDISDYRDIYDEKRNCQFAAIKFSLEDGTAYIAFRGTDKTIVGWRENFMMSFKETNAQLESVAYINDVIEKEDIAFRIGGHSKGGNLAVYSSVKCKPDIQNKILEIYNNDGPGFCKEIIQDNLLNSIKNRIHRIVPEYSVIGMLFEMDVPFQIVRSSEKGINQHDPFSWQVEGTRLTTCNQLNPKAQYLNKILDSWIEEEDMEQRKIFVEQMFDAMEASGGKEIVEVTSGLNNIEKVVNEIIYSDHKVKKVLHNLIIIIVGSFREINLIEVVHKRESLPGMIMIVLGMLLFVLPGEVFQILGTVFVFAIFVFSMVRLEHYSKEKSRYRDKNSYMRLAYFLCVLLSVLLAFHMSTLKLSINFTLGITIFGYGIIKLKTTLKSRIGNINITRLLWVQSVTSMSIGLAILGTPYYYIEKYLYVIGLYIIIIGLSEMVYEAYRVDSRGK